MSHMNLIHGINRHLIRPSIHQNYMSISPRHIRHFHHVDETSNRVKYVFISCIPTSPLDLGLLHPTFAPALISRYLYSMSLIPLVTVSASPVLGLSPPPPLRPCSTSGTDQSHALLTHYTPSSRFLYFHSLPEDSPSYPVCQ